MTGSHSSAMAADHSCCESSTEPAGQQEAHHHDCGWGWICTCNISESQLVDTEWIPSQNDANAELPAYSELADPLAFNEPIHPVLQTRIGLHSPPLWLMYDTFLI
jgi:hypothetical protein